MGFFFGKEAMQGQVYQQLNHLVGSPGSNANTGFIK
jgi:hypothetical protein